MGGVRQFLEFPGGGGYCVLSKMENPKGWGGSYMIFPPWWGYGYFLELHITCMYEQIKLSGSECNPLLKSFTCNLAGHPKDYIQKTF